MGEMFIFRYKHLIVRSSGKIMFFKLTKVERGIKFKDSCQYTLNDELEWQEYFSL